MGPVPHPLNIAGSTCNNAMKLCSLKEQSSVNILKQPKFRFRLHFFDDAINKAFSGQQTIQKSRKPVNYFIDCHHFTVGIAGPDKQLRAMSGS